MKRCFKIFALMFILLVSFSGQAFADPYAFGGFKNIKGHLSWYTQQTAWSHSALELLAPESPTQPRLEWIANSASDTFELFIIGGAGNQEVSLKSYSGAVDVTLNSGTDFDNMVKYYNNVSITDLYFNRYNEHTKAYDDVNMYDILVSKSVPTSVHPEGILRNGISMLLATEDMFWNGMQILKGDVLMGFEHYFDYINGNQVQGIDKNFTDMVFVMRGSRAVPVPAAVWLMGSGLAGIAALRRRMK